MFFLYHNLEVRFKMHPHHMNRAATKLDVISLIKDRVEGTYYPDYGLIIQVLPKNNSL